MSSRYGTTRRPTRRRCKLEEVQELITRARPILAGMGERLEMRTVGGKGLAPRPS